jgi:hypothetical protein
MINTDKHYWHRYIDKYRQVFEEASHRGPVRTIVEWGVLNGDSIAWLRECFPHAQIHGLDIVSQKKTWPVDSRISYHVVDQGDDAAVTKFFRTINKPDLIIEDGSHVPHHQANCLRAGFRALNSKGTYIVEDIHTAYCAIIDKTRLLRHRIWRRLRLPHTTAPHLNVLSLLLALQHLRDTDDSVHTRVKDLADNSYFSEDDVMYLRNEIASAELFRRNRLPLRCWRCGTAAYHFHTLRCQCGADVFGVADSMSYIVVKR